MSANENFLKKLLKIDVVLQKTFDWLTASCQAIRCHGRKYLYIWTQTFLVNLTLSKPLGAGSLIVETRGPFY